MHETCTWPRGQALKHGDNQRGDIISSTRMVMSQLQEANFWVEPPFFRDGLANLFGGIATPLKHMSSSIGMMTFPRYGKMF